MTALSSLIDKNGKRLLGLADEVAARLAPHGPPLPPAIDAELKTMTTHRGVRLAYYCDRTRRDAPHERPLVLVHSLNACASSYEMRPLFEHYRATRPTFAVDLPGFGRSARDARPYTIELYVDSLRELLARVKDSDGAADVIALSLGGELAARVASEHGDLVHSLALLSPTGFGEGGRHRSTFEPLKRAVRQPVVSRLLFDAIASRPSIRYFLRKSFVGEPDAGLVDYAYATSHQDGAYRAPIAFLCGDLFTPDVRESVYARVSAPTLVVHDTDAYARFDALPAFVASHPRWHSERVAPTRGMPQFEQLGTLVSTLETFWHRSGRARVEG